MVGVLGELWEARRSGRMKGEGARFVLFMAGRRRKEGKVRRETVLLP
jgi:hypothetical protein